MKKEKNSEIKLNSRKAALINLIMYQFLLIATPFLLVRNYLQQAIGQLSQWSFELGRINIPYLLAGLAVFFIIIIILLIRRLSLRFFIGLAAALFMMALGQSLTDYYFNHDFYELQHNWHYLAYGIFAWVSFLYHREKGTSFSSYIWRTFAIAVIISSLDETAQIFISSRVFDICDVGKDIWGVVTGLTVILISQWPKFAANDKKLLPKKITALFSSAASSLLLLTLFSLIFLSISSILSDNRFLLPAVLWSVSIFALVYLYLYFWQFKYSRWGLLIITLALGIILIWQISRERDNVLIQKEPGVLQWRGLPVYYFDLMLPANGCPRLVDKKLYFNKKDKINRIYGLCEDILLIGSGSRGQGGRGFSQEESSFVFNPVRKKPLQILIYPNTKACRIYNQLTAEGKDVLFIIHNN